MTELGRTLSLLEESRPAWQTRHGQPRLLCRSQQLSSQQLKTDHSSLVAQELAMILIIGTVIK